MTKLSLMNDEKDKKRSKTHMHEDLEGFNVRINRFGQIESTFDIDKINEFLNENVDDKKLREKAESTEEE